MWYRIIEISIVLWYLLASMNVVFIKYERPIDISIMRYHIVHLADPGTRDKKRDIDIITYSSYRKSWNYLVIYEIPLSISRFLSLDPGSARCTMWYRIISISIGLSYFIKTTFILANKYERPIDISIMRYHIVHLADPGTRDKKRDIDIITYSSYRKSW